MTDNVSENKKRNTSTSFAAGAVALVFLAIGYQTALFVHRAAVAGIVSNKDNPDTVYVYYTDNVERSATEGHARTEGKTHETGQARYGERPEDRRPYGRVSRKNAVHSPQAQKIREKFGRRSYESFSFDPNTASTEELERLGFSAKQAKSIDNYRKAGGRFRKKEDFAKSFVVADSVYKRLEDFIVIAGTDMNEADSAAFDALPGIGPYYASRIVAYRKRLGGFSFKEQLMDLKGFDMEKFDKLKELISIAAPRRYPLWTLPEDSLAAHPYIGRQAAHGIILFRDNNPSSAWTVANLRKAGVLSESDARKLELCTNP